MIINSNSNEKIKNIKKLYEKKYRDKENKYIIEGIKIVYEAYTSNQNFCAVVICEKILENVNIEKEYINDIINKCNEKIIYVSESVFKNLSDTVTPQGILAVIEKKEYDIGSKSDNILFLDRVQDLGNIGTIIRTACAFGYNTIVLNEGCADIYNPKVLRSTMGNIFKLNILFTYNNGIDFLKQIKNEDYQIYVTTLDKADNIYNMKFNNKKIIVVGNEANGVCDDILKIADKKIKIPMQNDTESLNVAIATGIILYESNR